MIARISFDNGQRITFDELNDLEISLADKIKTIPQYKNANGDFETFWSYCNTLDPSDPLIVEGKKKLLYTTEYVILDSDKEYVADLDLFLQKHPAIKIKIRGMVKTVETNFTSLMDQISAIQIKFEKALATFDKHVEFNEKCDVHIGNLGLLSINQVAYAEDKCTEELQLLLDKGWRLLAICPQSNQRRPDYILGRYNPAEKDVSCQKF